MRELTTAFKNAAIATEVRIAYFVEMEWDGGTTRVWSGYGDFSWDSKTWSGVGDLGSISVITETTDVKAAGVTLALSGIPSSIVSLVLSDDYHGRPVTIWIGLFDSAWAVIANPYEVFGGKMDVCEIDERGEEATVKIYCENSLVDLKKARTRRYTDVDQQGEFSGDKFFEFVPDIQDKTILWGQGSAIGGPSAGGGVTSGNGPLASEPEGDPVDNFYLYT